MTRARLRTGPVALFLGFVLAAALVFMPLRFVVGVVDLGRQGLSARSVDGTIWAGHLSEAHFGDIALGDLDARLSPLALLAGRAAIALSRPAAGDDAGLKGVVSISRHSIGVRGVTASVPSGEVFAPLPVTALDLDDLTATLRDGTCDQASGRVRAQLSGDFGGIALPTTIAGDARCDAGELMIPLVSAAGGEGVTMRLSPDGRYRAVLMLTPGDAPTATKLEAAGFVRAGAGYQLAIEGRF